MPTNLYVATNEEFIATLKTPGSARDVLVWLWLPIWLDGFSVVPDEDDVIHFAAFP